MCSWTILGSLGASYQLATVSSGDCMLPYHVPLTSSSNPTTSSSGWHMGIGGYGVMIPEQAQRSDTDSPLGFTIEYTLHNGFDNANQPVNNELTYYYKFSSTSEWLEGRKYIYKITFTLNEIIVSPSVSDWNPQSAIGVGI